MNWLLQIWAITKFGLLSIPQRRGAVAATMFGIAGVVAVLVGVLSIAAGFQKVMAVSASPDAAVVLRSGADSEMVSGLTRDDTRVISDAPGIMHTGDGPMASSELFVIIDLPKRSTGTSANVPFRGVEKNGTLVRGNIKIVEGRMFDSGKNEIIVGAGAAGAFRGLDIGHTLQVGRNQWLVTGKFTANGGVAESELWTDAHVLQEVYHRGDSFQSVCVKLNSPDDYQKFKDSLTSNPQVHVKVERQAEFYEDQSKTLTRLITTLGVLIAGLMALGAVFGALNTMYSAVSTRTREIATLRALGFGQSAILVSLLMEAVALALIGGAVGAAFAYFAFNGLQTSTMNMQNFSQVTFAFRVTPLLLVQGIIWAACIGLFGGIFPAFRACRLQIASALREL